MHTRILNMLLQNNIQYEDWHVKPPQVTPGYTQAQVTKTLFLRSTSKTSGVYCLVVAPKSRPRVNFEKIAECFDVGRMQLAPLAEVEARLGYPPEGISPLACGGIPVIMDALLMAHPRILVGAGTVGGQIGLAPADVVELTGAKVIDLTLLRHPGEPLTAA